MLGRNVGLRPIPIACAVAVCIGSFIRESAPNGFGALVDSYVREGVVLSGRQRVKVGHGRIPQFPPQCASLYAD